MITLSLKLSFVYSIVKKDCFNDHVLKNAKSLLKANDIILNMII